jgi:hypothetical protein
MSESRTKLVHSQSKLASRIGRLENTTDYPTMFFYESIHVGLCVLLIVSRGTTIDNWRSWELRRRE